MNFISYNVFIHSYESHYNHHSLFYSTINLSPGVSKYIITINNGYLNMTVFTHPVNYYKTNYVQ